MQFSLIVNHKGKRRISWGSALVLFFVLIVLPALLSVGVYYLVAERWSTLALEGGLAAGLVTAIFTLIMGLRTPLHMLPLKTEPYKKT